MTSFAMLPPEVNSLRMFTGAGSAPMLNAATAWDSMASELGVAASSFSSVTSGLAGDVWQGAASAAMTAAASSYAKLLGAASTRAAAAATQAKAVAGVFEDARAAMVHPLAVAANR
ncbi:PPE family protein, partial [Mycobacterium marinum]